MKTKQWKKLKNAANPFIRRPRAAGLRWSGVAGLAALTLAAAAPAAESPAKPPAAPSITDFADLGLDQLANMSVTSVGKKEQKLTAAPAAIYVLTEEDVRRSGATSIPEAQCLVPGQGATFTLERSVESLTNKEAR